MQNLIEYIVRQKIYDSLYWKQECFGLTAERIVDKAVDIRFVGGMYGEPQKPTEFICLLLKMLQIQPDKEIIMEYIKNDDFKYLRLLGAFYLRLTGRAIDVFNYLEPLLNDYRRVRIRRPTGVFELTHIDQLIDEMLRSDYMFHIALPRLPPRPSLEKIGQLEPRVSILQEEFDEAVKREEEEREQEKQAKQQEERRRRDKRQPEKWQVNRRDDTRGGGGGDYHESKIRKGDRDRNGGYGDHRDSDYRDRRDRDNDYRDRDDARRGGSSYNRDGDRRRRDDDIRDQKSDGRRLRDDDSEEEEGQFRDDTDGGGAKESLSVEATNKLRAELGLPPLK